MNKKIYFSIEYFISMKKLKTATRSRVTYNLKKSKTSEKFMMQSKSLIIGIVSYNSSNLFKVKQTTDV